VLEELSFTAQNTPENSRTEILKPHEANPFTARPTAYLSYIHLRCKLFVSDSNNLENCRNLSKFSDKLT